MPTAPICSSATVWSQKKKLLESPTVRRLSSNYEGEGRGGGGLVGLLVEQSQIVSCSTHASSKLWLPSVQGGGNVVISDFSE